jgi:hypothetical protein
MYSLVNMFPHMNTGFTFFEKELREGARGEGQGASEKQKEKTRCFFLYSGLV